MEFGFENCVGTLCQPTFMALWIWLQMQSLRTSDDNCRCEAVACNIFKRFYFSLLDVLGYNCASLYRKQVKISCSWVKLINIFHKAW